MRNPARYLSFVGRALTLLLFVLMTISLISASCVTELNTIARTPRGRVKSPKGEPVAGAEIKVISPSGDIVYRTKSLRDGSFLVAPKPGKYRVEMWAEGYLMLLYVVDLRGRASTEPFDVWFQGVDHCHDIRIASSDTNRDKCGSEVLRPNLILRGPAVISGHVKDETGAPFKRSQLELKKLSDSILQPAYLDAKTDEEGRFTFDEAEPGDYRLLASPTRAFSQPERLDCQGLSDCRLEIVLKANPTDLPYAGCPVQ